MGSFAIGKRGWEQDLIADVLVSTDGVGGAGRVLVLADLIKVAFFHGDRRGRILGKEIGSETRKSEEVVLEGLGESEGDEVSWARRVGDGSVGCSDGRVVGCRLSMSRVQRRLEARERVP